MRSALFNYGFRIFFASASVATVFSMLWWLSAYHFGYGVQGLTIAPMYVHAHEMVFGYSMAVVAGFLLTATGVWTRQPMPHGKTLFFIWLPWFIARICFLFGFALIPAMLLDMVFAVLLSYFFGKPVFAVKQWKQMGIFSKTILLVIANLLFIAGTLNWLRSGQLMGLQLGFFIIIGLLLTIGRRITPFFIQNATGAVLRNSALLDRLSLFSFLIFFIFDVFTPWQTVASICALITAVSNGWRLIGWYTKKVWRVPLLWSMYLSLWFIVAGFVLYFLRIWLPISSSLALHMIAVGGLGLMTFSMIGRVSLGHTGRNIHAPPKRLFIGFILMISALFFRVIMPLFLPQFYPVWIIHAQVSWILAFALLVSAYAKIWNSPRPDGRPG